MSNAKRMLCMAVACAVLIMPFTASASGDRPASSVYTTEQAEYIVNKYMNYDSMLDAIFAEDDAVGYWTMVHNNNENSFYSWLLDTASNLVGEDLDKPDYARILTNLMTMRSGELSEQIENQNTYDDLYDGTDFLIDAVDIVGSFASGAGISNDVIDTISQIGDGTETVIDSVEQAKYYQATIQDYAQSEDFLSAIEQYAQDETLRDVAASLSSVSTTLLEKRLEYIGDSAEQIATYQTDFFIDDLAFDLLKQTDLYGTDDTARWFIDAGEDLVGLISSDMAAGGFAFKSIIVAGNMAFGTTDMFNRYQEMQVLADVADSLVKALDAIHVTSGSVDALDSVQRKCSYYQSLLVTHARGEYLVYSLLVNDGGLLSAWRNFWESFKDEDKTTEAWYRGQVNTISRYYDVLQTMFDIPATLTGNNGNTTDSVTDDEDDDTDKRLDIDGATNETDTSIDGSTFADSTPGDTDVMLVLDISSSMDGTPLADTKDAASAFVDTDFDKDTRIGLVVYATQAEQISPLTRDDQRLHEDIDDLSVLGNTNIEDGLSTAQAALDAGGADKKIIVLMSDGEPNEGLVGDDLIDYADSIRDDGIRLYTLGFNEGPDGQRLLAGIADEGRHYEVQDSSDLTGFFSDIADEINGTRFVYIKAACPIEITVSYDGETLSSAGEDPSTRTSFGTLTFEASDEADPTDETDANNVKVLRLREGPAYDVQISGTGDGSMTYTIGFVDDDGEYNDFRTFSDIAITPDTAISTSAEVAETTTLRVDEDGDGTVDKTYRAGANEEGQLVDNSWIAGVALVACIVVVAVIAFVVIRISISKNKRRRTS